MDGMATEARMKYRAASLSMAFVREGPPLPPAPIQNRSAYVK
jgi:hypothetical protein